MTEPSSSERILVVDDDAATRKLLERWLAATGHDVLAVDTGERALSSLSTFRPALVVCDVRLPGLGGLDVLDRVRSHAPGILVLLVTAYDEVQLTIDAIRRGAFDYLVKPLDRGRLEGVVREALRSSHLASEVSAPPAPTVTTTPGEPIGRDPAMREVYKQVGAVALSRAPVLITGETGTGKELIARTIHRNGTAPDEPFEAVNCAAVPETLLESELFGHVRGAFTGASADRRGRFELAAGGTIFLDEIGETEPAFQAKLLRVLQEREFHPVGAERARPLRARIVAATNRELSADVTDGRFREDLYYRLRVVEIVLPPLRERRGDIPLLVHHIARRAARERGTAPPVIPDEVMARLVAAPWPGNVRQLENAVVRATLLARGGVLDFHEGDPGPAAPPPAPRAADAPGAADASLDEIEAAHVARVLDQTGGNKSAAARILRISRPRLDRILSKRSSGG